MNKNDAPITPKGALALAISSWTYLLRAITIIEFFLLVIIALLRYFFYLVESSQSQFKINFTKNGATILVSPNEQFKALFILPGSSRWTNTGIVLQPQEKFRIRASGKVHLAFHRLAESALDDTRPGFGWIEPTGEPWVNLSQSDALRRKLLILPDANIGALLGYLHAAGTPEPSIHNSKPEGIIVIGEETVVVNNSQQEVELWLVLNETILDPNDLERSKKGYINPEKRIFWEKRWEYIVRDNYWDLWWDDNIGHYLVQIEQL